MKNFIQKLLTWYQESRLQTQLLMGFGVVIMLTLFLGTISIMSVLNSVSAVDELIGIDNRIADYSLRSSQAMLKARRAERQFLLTKDDIGVTKARDNQLPTLKSNLGDLRTFMAGVRRIAKDPEIIKKANELEVNSAVYEEQFSSLVNLYIKLGDANSGSEAQIRNAGEELFALVKSNNQAELVIDILTLRTNEKEFVNHPSSVTLKSFLNRVKTFRDNIQRSTLSSGEKQRMGSLLTKYSQVFARYAEMAKVIETASDGYLKAAFMIEPLIEDLSNSAIMQTLQTRERVQASAQITMWTIIITASIATILGALVALFVSRRITSSVKQLVSFAKSFATGDFSARTDPVGEHEFAIVGHALNRMADVIEDSRTELENHAKDMQHKATHDKLTKLPNRAVLDDRLKHAIAYAKRYKRFLAVVFIDLDNFKTINDTLGHNMGDEILKASASRMLGCVRDADTVVRLGGDEFVILLLDQSDQKNSILQTLEKIRARVAEPVIVDGQTLKVTCSMGAAIYPTDGLDKEVLLANADLAMYRSKELGRNNFQLYDIGMAPKPSEKPAK